MIFKQISNFWRLRFYSGIILFRADRETYLKLSPLPVLDEKTPLIGHAKNANKPIINDRPIRHLVQACFDQAADQLELENKHRRSE